jgi:predicted GNAT family N-acyltransferase
MRPKKAAMVEEVPLPEGVTIRIVPHGSELYWKAIELRSKYLREPLGLTINPEELEADANSFHIVATSGNDAVGNVTLVPYTQDTIRLRHMIVDPALRKQNLGRKLIKTADQVALDNGCTAIELYARDVAVDFYRKCGYEIYGASFVKLGIPHRAMKKQLKAG